MKDLSSIKVCIVDDGLSIPIARKMAESVDTVFYYKFSDRAFPVIREGIIGDGYDNIVRINDLWKIKKDVDLFMFPDIHNSGLQLELESQGFPVWGSREADSIEIDRQKFLKTLEEVGLSVPKYVVKTGLSELSELLKDKEDCYIKISRYRGDFETFHWRSWRLDSGTLDQWAVKIGAAKELLPFLVFDKIETPFEIGGDTYCIDGQWPEKMLHGIEWKDKSYLAAVTSTPKMPRQILEVMAAFAPMFEKFRYRNQFSMEIRPTDDDYFFTDPTCRLGLPSTASQLELLDNFAEIVWVGANGELIQPEYKAKFAAECIVKYGDKGDNWRVTEIPEEIRQWFKFSDCCEIDGQDCFPPNNSNEGEIGWLCAIGDTPEETIENIKSYADQMPDGLDVNVESMADILKEIEKMEEAGIHFTDVELPEPAIAVED